MFELSKEALTALSAEITTREIKQQPELWQEAIAYYRTKQSAIDDFLAQIVAKHQSVRVVFTGAGTSAYVGDTVLPYLKGVVNEHQLELQSVPTTDLVSNPHQFFKADIPTLLVSFARSGNSPESVAAVTIGQQLVRDFYQLTITCAPQGQLAQKAQGDDHNLLLLMPERANDQGFAMTGSYSCMTLTALLVFDPRPLSEKEAIVTHLVAMGQEVLRREPEIQALVAADFNRVVYLGSGSLAGVAREAQLKILELTAGQVATAFDSSMGFRHGPKSFIDDQTLVFDFVSQDPYTRQYDCDILREMDEDGIARLVCAVTVAGDTQPFTGACFAVTAPEMTIPDGYLALPYVVFAQTVSLLSAVKVGNKPDTPSPSGTVNRVVQGVIIHDNY